MFQNKTNMHARSNIHLKTRFSCQNGEPHKPQCISDICSIIFSFIYVIKSMDQFTLYGKDFTVCVLLERLRKP